MTAGIGAPNPRLGILELVPTRAGQTNYYAGHFCLNDFSYSVEIVPLGKGGTCVGSLLRGDTRCVTELLSSKAVSVNLAMYSLQEKLFASGIPELVQIRSKLFETEPAQPAPLTVREAEEMYAKELPPMVQEEREQKIKPARAQLAAHSFRVSYGLAGYPSCRVEKPLPCPIPKDEPFELRVQTKKLKPKGAAGYHVIPLEDGRFWKVGDHLYAKLLEQLRSSGLPEASEVSTKKLTYLELLDLHFSIPLSSKDPSDSILHLEDPKDLKMEVIKKREPLQLLDISLVDDPEPYARIQPPAAEKPDFKNPELLTLPEDPKWEPHIKKGELILERAELPCRGPVHAILHAAMAMEKWMPGEAERRIQTDLDQDFAFLQWLK